MREAKSIIYQAFQINVNAVFHIIFTLFSILDLTYKAMREVQSLK